MRVTLAASLVFLLVTACRSSEPDPAATVRTLHERILQAHRDRDAAAFTAVEAETTTVANRGRITLLARADRLAARERYFAATRFAAYRDLRPPLVQVSRDQTMAWLVAHVEVISYADSGAAVDSTHTVWAWIELYQRGPLGWRLVGNVSNERPGPP